MYQTPCKERMQQNLEQRDITLKKELRDNNDFPRTRKKSVTEEEQHHRFVQHPRSQKISRKDLDYMFRDFMQRSQYSKADQIKNAIKYMNQRQRVQRKRKLSQEHSMEKQIVKASHAKEMSFFRQAWRQVFMEQSMKQRLMMKRFDRLRMMDEEECKQRITKRCQSAKPVSQIAKLYQLEQTEKLLRKRGKTTELKQIKKQKKKVMKSCQKQQEKAFIRIAEEEKKKMVEKQTRRYKSFMHRIQEQRKDQERYYKREEQKLRQKYRNILKNLEHEQSQEINQFSKFLNY